MAGKEILAIKPRDQRERGELRVSPVIAGARQRGAISFPGTGDCRESIAGARQRGAISIPIEEDCKETIAGARQRGAIGIPTEDN
ncbi:hypothetical protein C3V36_03600 [Lachnospiraceae bacterium oral taxon 500]|nr:hypothetical protein C3V36_03600 [Lachnospiraceae bacterium oral taxon 500]